MRDFIETFVTVFVFFAVFFALIIGLADLGARYSCNNYKKVAGKETKYITLDSCYIKTADGFQRWDEYKMRAAASEGLKAK